MINGNDVPLDLVPGDKFNCAGVDVTRDAVRAAGEDRIPGESNGAIWVAAYAADTVITIVAAPFAVVYFAALLRYGGAASSDAESTATGLTAGQAENVYRQERIREQILQHGAGGCAPNVATGGCL